MALAMSRPWKHPKTGVYWLRKRVPNDLIALVGKPEAKQTLGTKDPVEAKRLHLEALTRLESQWANLRAGPRTLSEVEAHALVAGFYKPWTDQFRDNPSDQTFWRVDLIDRLWLTPKQQVDIFRAAGEILPDWWMKAQAQQEWCLEFADTTLKNQGLVVDEAGRLKLARAVAFVAQRAALFLERRAKGFLDESDVLSFGHFASNTAVKSAVADLSFDQAINLWIAEKQPAPKTIYEWRRVMRQLEVHLGHADAHRLTPEDMIAWKSAMIGLGQRPKTIRDAKLAPVRAILQVAVNNRKLPGNPVERIQIDVRMKTGEARRGFTDKEAISVLSAANRQSDPVLRWVPWLCAYSGARVSEVCQLRREDVHEHEGVWCMLFAAEAGSLKNANSERAVPLHPALINAGFLTFIKTISTGPIFADLPPDKFGKRGGNGTKVLGRFVRNLGLTDLRLGPNHSWRHRFKTQGRTHGLALDLVNAITGHGRKTVADSYGEFPMPALYREIAKIPALQVDGSGH